MANYKVVDSEFLDAGMTQIANAIREKSGTSGNLAFPNAMVSAISDIQAGGGDSMANAIIGRTLTSITSDATKIGMNAFYEYTDLVSVSFPKVTSIGRYAFYACSNLESIHFPEATSTGDTAFFGCSKLTSASFPKANMISTSSFRKCAALTSVDAPLVTTVSNYAFGECTGLTKIRFPKITYLDEYVFSGCSYLKIIDLYRPGEIRNRAFGGCGSLVAVVIRNTSLTPCSNSNAFYNCSHFSGTSNPTYNPNNLKDGYVYVPAALVSSYQSATNWSTLGADRFRALEDYTVDGTITGELDESKI